MSKCIECENEIMLKYSALACDYDEMSRRARLAEEALRATRRLCDFYSERCEMLENQVRLYKDKVERDNAE